MILYRPVGLQELELIYDGGMKAFPARLPQQPIFYPVLTLEYARQIASDWNAKSGELAGYVTEFRVEDAYINKFEKHTVGGSQHQEFWIPAEELEEFNQHITGHIKVVEAHFGDTFQGFIPDKFGLQGKNAVEQFTQLANSYIYKRMEFYLEIKRNHKAVFLNYPFWQKHDFQNQGLKKKILQAIKEAWFTSFPKIPLPNPPPEDIAPVKPADADPLPSPLPEDSHFIEELEPDTLPTSDPEESTPVEEPEPGFPPIQAPVEERTSHALPTSLYEAATPADEEDSDELMESVDEDPVPVPQPRAPIFINRVPQHPAPARRTASHFARGLELGLSGNYHEAVDELSRAVEEDPSHIVAQTSLGVACHRLGQDARALSCYDAALKIDSKYSEAHYFRANILYEQGATREAIAGYTTAVGLDPGLIDADQKPLPQDRLTDYTNVPAEMVWIARRAHRILQLNHLLETNPRQANLFKERAAQYSRLANYEQAIADYGSALALQPEDANALHLRGLAYEQVGQFDRALEDFQRAIAINPQLSDVYIHRGVTLGKLGNFRQSVNSLTEGIRLAPQNPDAYFNRGISYFQQGDFQRAIEDFSNVVRLSPKDDTVYYWRGLSHEAAGNQREAIADYKQVLTVTQDARTRDEVEQKLRQWNIGKQESVSRRSVASEDQQQNKPKEAEKPDQAPDLHAVIAALGERAVNSTWFGSGVDCYGDKADELYAFTDRNRPIPGRDLLRITTGIQQTVAGDFEAFDPNAASPWLFIRAWNGNGFYMETNDAKIKERLKTRFPSLEEVEGATAPYESLFIRT